MKALLGRPIWMFPAWRRKSRFNIAIKMWWTTQILIYTHRSRIQRDLKRIPDIWVHQWRIVRLNPGCRWGGGGNTPHRIPTTGEKKSTNLWSNIQLRTFRRENKKRAWGFCLDLRWTENLKVFYRFMWNQELLTENTPKLQQYCVVLSHSSSSGVQSVFIYRNSFLFMHLSVQ